MKHSLEGRLAVCMRGPYDEGLNVLVAAMLMLRKCGCVEIIMSSKKRMNE